MICKNNAVIILCASFLISSGCEKKDQQRIIKTLLNNKEIICPMLYQKSDSVNNALVFIEVPEDRLESYISSVSETGELTKQDQLSFANILFSLRKSKDVELYISILGEKTKEQLQDDNKNGILLQRISSIQEGTFLYGEYDYKYFATFDKLSKEQQDGLQIRNFTETPTYNIVYWHFHKPKNMLIGTTVYFTEDSGSFKIVDGTLPKSKIPQ